MGLPNVSLKTRTVEIDGQQVEVRELSRGEAMALAQQADESDPAAQERRVLAFAMDVPLEQVEAWYDGAPSGVVQRLVTTIMALSGLDDLPNGSSAG
jgi:hypothetical protein